jgi:heat shock protein HslJ
VPYAGRMCIEPRYRLPMLALTASLLTAACTNPAAPTPAAIEGTWTLRALRQANGAEQATPGGAAYAITIENDRVAVQADCNTCSGSATLASSTLTLGPALACTRAFCATAAFESVFTTALSGDHTATVSGGSLTLSSTRGSMQFDR